MKERRFFEDIRVRNKYADKINVLEDIKDLSLISGTEYAVVSQVADYYEVDLETIKSLIFDNREELMECGLLNITGKETKQILVKSLNKIINKKGYFVCDGIKFAHRNNLLFPKKAILRVGMLLRDSIVSHKIRIQLLNIENEISSETKIKNMTEEQRLMVAVGMAIFNGNLEELKIASDNLTNYKNKQLKQL